MVMSPKKQGPLEEIQTQPLRAPDNCQMCLFQQWEYDGDSLNSDNWWTHVDRHQHYPIIAMFHGETMPHVFVYSVQGSIY